MKELNDYVRSIPDFPEKGIIFRDITTVFQDADGLKLAIDSMQEFIKDLDFDILVGAEARNAKARSAAYATGLMPMPDKAS